VNNELGDGFLESVYESALYIVLTGYGLCVERQRGISATNIEVGLLLNFGRKPEFKRFVYDTWVERFNVQGSGLMNPNRLNPKELRLHRGGK